MIKAEALTKVFGEHNAVDNVSFQVKTGEVLGFLGPNGAGKSTTMRMLTGYLPPTSGTIVIDGFNMEEKPIQARSSIGYLPENAPLYTDMSVYSFLDFTAGIRGLRGEDKRKALDNAIEICQLDKVLDQTIDTLSKGYRHRTCFAQAILCDPKVLVLDEPTDGLDPNQKHQMRQLIAEMGKNKAIIVSTHILEEVEAICTRVAIIDKGSIVFNGTPAQLRAKAPEAGAVVVKCNLALEQLNQASSIGNGIGQVKQLGEGEFMFMPAKEGATEGLLPNVRKLFSSKGWDFSEIYVEKGRLDEVFRIITTNETAEGVK